LGSSCARPHTAGARFKVFRPARNGFNRPSIIIVQGNDLELGLLADVVVGVRSIAAEAQLSLPTLTGVQHYLKGVTAERLVVLDLARILADPKIIVDEKSQPERKPSTETLSMKWNVGTKIGVGFGLSCWSFDRRAASYWSITRLIAASDARKHSFGVWPHSRKRFRG
jgi:hypothetical protein